MPLPDVQDDCARFEEMELAVLPSRNLSEWIKPPMIWRLEFGKGHETNIVWLSNLLQRPPDAEIARQCSAAVRRGSAAGNAAQVGAYRKLGCS